MEEASWRRHNGRGIREEASGRKASGISHQAGGIMQKASWGRHCGGSIMEEGGTMEEASWRHPGDIWEASGRHPP